MTELYGYDDVNKILYYQSNEASPLEKDIYRINVWGKSKEKLSNQNGTNNAVFSKNYTYFINTHSDANSPNNIALFDKNGTEIRTIKNSKNLRKTIENYSLTKR